MQANNTRACRSRTFYIENEVNAWLDRKFGNSRGKSKFVRELLRKCMEQDLETKKAGTQ